MLTNLKQKPGAISDSPEKALRKDLAAVFRLAAREDWHEAVANHFSVAVSDDGKTFLMNPRWRHFSRICASDLLLLHADDGDAMSRPDAPDPSAWAIHGQIHAARRTARCILHVHSTYATVIASLADPTIKPVDQNAARFFRRVSLDLSFGGIADNREEGARIAAVLGDRNVLMMGNHGVLVVEETVAEAFDTLYFLERSCRNLALAYATGQPLSVMPNEVAERTAQGWEDYRPLSFAHLKFSAFHVHVSSRHP